MNIAIAQGIVLTVAGKDVSNTDPITDDTINPYCDDACLDNFLSSIIRMVPDPNPASRSSTGIWLLALVKNCPKRAPIYKRKEILQYAFTELLSDDSGKSYIRRYFYRHSIENVDNAVLMHTLICMFFLS